MFMEPDKLKMCVEVLIEQFICIYGFTFQKKKS